MPAEETQFRGKLKRFTPDNVSGLFAYKEAVNAPHQAAKFTRTTGVTDYADATAAQAANITLVNASECPTGMRPYLTRVDVEVMGAVNWSSTAPTAGSIAGLSLQDTAGSPLLILPYSALKGNAGYSFPGNSGRVMPMILGPGTVTGPIGAPTTTFTINAAGTGITAAATSFIANYGIGGCVRVIDGTGKGQTALITGVTATVLTVAPALVGLDATSVLAVDYQTLQTYTDTTHVVLWAGGGTPYTANALDNAYQLLGVLPVALAGSSRRILSNTTAGAIVLTEALNAAFTQATTLAQITNAPWLNGAVDCGIGKKYPMCALNSGIQIVANHYAGTAPLGSAVRFHVEGYWAF